MEWVGEDSASVVPCHRVSEGECRIGEVSKVRTSAGIFDAVVAATG